MKLPTEIFGDVIVIHTPKDLGPEECRGLEGYEPLPQRPGAVLDLDATENVDSKGLTTLLDLQDKFRDMAGEVKIATTNPTNRKILEMTRLDQQIEVFENIVDAVKSFHQL
jgi:anti-sigma B factor antagonist